MQKKFLTNLGFLLLLNLIIKPVWIFGIDMTVQNIVGAADYGFYFTIFNFSFLFNILFDFGITNFNNRNIAQNNQLLNKHFSSILILKVLLGMVYFLITFLVAFVIGYRGEAIKMLLFLGINQFLISFILYLRSNVSALLFFKTDSVLSVLDRIVMIAICSVLLWGGVTKTPFRIEWFVYSQTVAYIITFFVAFIIVLRKASFKRLNWNFPFFLVILKQSLPYAILILLMTFYNRIDSVMLERLIDGTKGEEQVGIYAHAYRLLDAANNIAYLFSLLLLPMFATLIKNKSKINNLVKLSFSILFVCSVVVTIGCSFYSYPIMDLLYDHFIPESSRVFPILMSCFIAISTSYVFGTLLTANGSLSQLNYLAAAGMVLNLLLNFLLIPRLGALGSAWASMVTQFIMAIVQVILCCLYFKLKISIDYISKLLAFTVGVVLINLGSKYLPLHWIYSFLIMTGCSVLWAAVLKLLNIGYFWAILKENKR